MLKYTLVIAVSQEVQFGVLQVQASLGKDSMRSYLKKRKP
jgi:hypothetical protein